MAKKHSGLLLLGAAALGVAAGTLYYLKKTDPDRFEDDDFDFDDFDDFDDEDDEVSSKKRNYVPLNRETGSDSSDETASVEEEAKEEAIEEAEEIAVSEKADEIKEELEKLDAANSETIEEFFDEEDEESIDDSDSPIDTEASDEE